MKLGLIGTGKQGQRYLMEKNGGRHIVRSGSRDLDDWEGLDGVIIATHPAGHKALCLKAIERGLAVLCEKPLALNLADCEEVIDEAEDRGVPLEVAHTHLWNREWPDLKMEAVCAISYRTHERDYSPWLDWAPHGLALLASAMPDATTSGLVHSLAVYRDPDQDPRLRLTWVNSMCGPYVYPNYLGPPLVPPMFLMLRDFCLGETSSYQFNRRIYRALFAEE